MVNNCRIGDGKGFSESERSRGYFRIKATEFFKQKFAENNINYDYGRKHDRSYSLFEREFFDAESTEKLDKHLKAFQTYKAAEAAGADDETLKPLKAEVSAHKFVWKELLIKNIKDCIAHSTSYDDFVANCPNYGIIYGDSRKHNQFRLTPEEYARYTDAPYPEKKATCRGKTLGGLAKEDLMAYFDSLTDERIAEISAQADEEVENQGISAGRA